MTEIETIRANLKKAAKRQPEAVQPFIDKLSTQLRNLAKADAEGRSALYPYMEDSMRKIEAGGCGR